MAGIKMSDKSSFPEIWLQRFTGPNRAIWQDLYETRLPATSWLEKDY